MPLIEVVMVSPLVNVTLIAFIFKSVLKEVVTVKLICDFFFFFSDLKPSVRVCAKNLDVPTNDANRVAVDVVLQSKVGVSLFDFSFVLICHNESVFPRREERKVIRKLFY